MQLRKIKKTWKRAMWYQDRMILPNNKKRYRDMKRFKRDIDRFMKYFVPLNKTNPPLQKVFGETIRGIDLRHTRGAWG